MALKVIGAGMGRTGTMSLKLALTQLLGGPCYHMVEVFPRPEHFGIWTAAARGEQVDWDAVFDGFVAAVDWPASAFWKELAARWPDAKILLSTRDSAGWWNSAHATIFSQQLVEKREGPMTDMLGAMLSSRFTSDIHDRDAAIAAYERNNADVRRTAPRDRLIEWTPADGWGPLCAGLGLPVPNEPFPHANTTDEFLARVEAGSEGGGPPPGH